MKLHHRIFIISLIVLAASSLQAATRYVDLYNPSPTPPYTTWLTAATNIQDAIDAANSGDLILVTNGDYAIGGRKAANGFITNRVAVIKPLIVQSVNGPAVTTIRGSPGPGIEAVRCVYLTNNAQLIGFTLTNGATATNVSVQDESGGGIYCASSNSFVSNCVISGNFARALGGGAHSGTLQNCVLRNNLASEGGGIERSRAYNCLLVGNSAEEDGGGAFFSSLINCTVVSNTAVGTGGGVYDNNNDVPYAQFDNCIIYDNTAGVGSNYAFIGIPTNSANFCCTLPLPVNGAGNITNAPQFVDAATGNFHLLIGSPCINTGKNSYVTNDVDLDGRPRIVGDIADMGAYEFQTHFVDLNSTNPISPYINWSTAATNIQEAADAATNGDLVLVTNGIYATGGRQWFGSGTNCVTLTNQIILQSVNGPAVTLIRGTHASGANAVRCLLLTTNALVSGFTLTNGQSGIGNYPQGGGVYCYSSSAIISNCVLAGNLASDSGGGAYKGKLINCILTNNIAQIGAGQSYGIANNCLFAGNGSSNSVTGSSGGAVYFGTLNNCTLVGNASKQWGAAVDSTLNNSVIYYNYNVGFPDCYQCQLTNCCTASLFSNTSRNTITNPPVFVDLTNGNYRLQAGSPCINSGTNAYVTTANDLDGNSRIIAGTVDMGAYENQAPGSVLPYFWAVQYGLPTDGSADFADSDGDGLNNWQEWIAGTVPTNAASVLIMSARTNGGGGNILTWQSVAGKTYFLQRATNLGQTSAFQPLRSNVVGQAGSTSFTDTNAFGDGPFFYRVGVQP